MSKNNIILATLLRKTHTGLDIGYVPAGPDAFFRWSGQFGPQQLIFYWPAGPVEFFIFFFNFFLGLGHTKLMFRITDFSGVLEGRGE